jgi:hypothetical protein
MLFLLAKTLNLSTEPDNRTPLPAKIIIINVCVDALKSGDTHYTNSMGLFELREAVAETTFKSRGFKPNIDQILLKHFTPEAKTNQEIKGIDQFIEMYAQAERPIILDTFQNEVAPFDRVRSHEAFICGSECREIASFCFIKQPIKDISS